MADRRSAARPAPKAEVFIRDFGPLAASIFEGAEPLDPDGYALETFYAAGLRSVGLTHSRRNRFARGVPFKFPHSPDTGTGLSDEGKALVRQLNRRKVMRKARSKKQRPKLLAELERKKSA